MQRQNAVAAKPKIAILTKYLLRDYLYYANAMNAVLEKDSCIGK